MCFTLNENLTDEAAAHLAKLPWLRYASFSVCCNLTDRAAAHLAKCARIETIDFFRCAGVTQVAQEAHEGVKVIVRC